MIIATAKELEFCLRVWGREFGELPPETNEGYDERDEAAPAGENTIATVREFAPSPKDAIKRACGVDRTVGRRLLVGAAAGLVDAKNRTLPAPSWSTDPIRAPKSRSTGAPWSPSPIAEFVERRVLLLHSHSHLAAVVLRSAYCLRGRRKLTERILWASERIGLPDGKRIPRRDWQDAREYGRMVVRDGQL